MPVLDLGARLAVLGDVFFQEPLGQLRHCGSEALGFLVLVRVPAVVDVGDGLAGPRLGLFEGEGFVAPDLDADGLSPPEGLGDVALSAVGVYADAESLELVVPHEILFLAGRKGVDVAFGELGHGKSSECTRNVCSSTERVSEGLAVHKG